MPRSSASSAERNRAEAPRDLVLAAAENYDWEQMQAFVESLEATGFDGPGRSPT